LQTYVYTFGVFRQKTVIIPKTIPKTDQKILALIRENPEISIQKIADLIGLSKIGIESATFGCPHGSA